MGGEPETLDRVGSHYSERAVRVKWLLFDTLVNIRRGSRLTGARPGRVVDTGPGGPVGPGGPPWECHPAQARITFLYHAIRMAAYSEQGQGLVLDIATRPHDKPVGVSCPSESAIEQRGYSEKKASRWEERQ